MQKRPYSSSGQRHEGRDERSSSKPVEEVHAVSTNSVASSVERRESRLRRWAVPLALLVFVTLAGLTFGYGRLLVAGSSTDAGNTSAAGNNGATSPASGAGTSQTVEGNGVSVTLSWEEQGAGQVFSVVMDTHSGSLDGYDLAELAVLRTGSGQEFSPVSWDAPKGGHHRKGTLTFPDAGPDGKPLAGVESGQVTVIIKGVADVAERVFTWTP